MRLPRFLVLLVLSLGVQAAAAAEKPAPASGASVEFQALVEKIQAKLKQGQTTEADLATELKEFDALIARVQDQKSEEAARIIIGEAGLYLQVLNQPEKAAARLRQLKQDFADTEPGKLADQVLQQMERREAAKHLVGKPAPEIHFNWASVPALKSLADVKGKVVILDFWATWCGPCVASFPDMRELAARYRDFPVAIIGVTSLQGRVMGLDAGPVDTQGDPEKELRLMADYIKAKNLTWTIAVSEEKVFNPDYGVEGIPHMVMLAPDGTVRHAELDPRDPLPEKAAKIDALLKEFKLKAPPALAAGN